jgi:hypothetical protein
VQCYQSGGPQTDPARPGEDAPLGGARQPRRRPAVSIVVAAALIPNLALGAGQPLWGYGVSGCEQYLKAADAADNGDGAEMQRYEDWLGGFFSALNLALGEDVLRGSGVRSAMRGTREYCRTHGGQDVFNAAMDHVRSLSSLR